MELYSSDIVKEPLILGIESSCDETAAAVICGRRVLSDEIASSANIQSLYGGVVPEIASRAHTDAIEAVVQRAVKNAGASYADLDGVAVTYGAGLLGALLVGVSFAKAFAYALGKPLIAVNHIRGHMAAAYLDDARASSPPSSRFWPAAGTPRFYTQNRKRSSRFSVRRSTTRRERRLTRWPACWGCVIPGGRISKPARGAEGRSCPCRKC